MQLISLSANKASFKTVHFKNEIGINLIVASQKNPGKSDKGDTTNGVGKSLLISIIHFCLGSSNKKAFKNQLDGWEFSLKFRIESTEYTSLRKTNNQNKIYLNGEELSCKAFNRELEKKLFNVPDNVSEITFRSLLSFFIRPRKASYISEANPNSIKKDYQIQVNNAFLLGLDVKLAEEKYQLKREKGRIKQFVDDLKNDKYINDFFVGNKDITLAKNELDETIEILEKNLNKFEVAEDYYDIKAQADEIKQKIEVIQNEINLLQIQIKNIDESRKISPDIKRSTIEKMYQEASVIINDDAIKKLSELEKFYEHITTNREKRLVDQKNDLVRKIEALLDEKHEKSRELNNRLKYLGAHHALDVFLNLSNKVSDAKSKRENLLKFEELLTRYKEEQRKINKKQIEGTEKTAKYLSESGELKSRLNSFFRLLAKRFYPKAAAGITIYNNEGDNQIRYNIEARIEADKSDGIGNVKIFCYDMTILLKGFGHKINFLFHDSRLLDSIDPRQVHELFLIIDEYTKASSKQYILTANYNQLEDIKQFFSSIDEYERIIEENKILDLKDNAPEEKLLGIQIDMDYD